MMPHIQTVGPVGIEPTTRDYEVGEIGRTCPVVSEWSRIISEVRPVASVSSGGVGLVCGMKRGIDGAAVTPCASSFPRADASPTGSVQSAQPVRCELIRL